VTSPRSRTGVRRAIVILPGAFTSGNLFFGIWSIIAATRGNFTQAAWLIVAGGICDALDGSAARMTRTGTAFGAELDSLVDAISFGVAPALLVYFHTFKGGEWSWVLSFLFILAVVLRLARFNVEQAGRAKSQFFGLPSPAAGIALATFYPFSQTPLFQNYLSGFWPGSVGLAVFMVLCSLLMVSHVPYQVWPRPGLRSTKGIISSIATLAALVAIILIPAYFVFPFIFLYIIFGVIRAVLLGLLERRPEREPLTDEDDATRPVEGDVNPKLLPFQIRRGRRRGEGGGGGAQ
jgi:CDP-diacylglycerol---serine O-phosphatidyltransferase